TGSVRSTSRSADPPRRRSTCCAGPSGTESFPASKATPGMPAAEWRVAPLATRRRTAITRAQVETVSGRALGLFGLVFGAQTLPMAVDQSSALIPGAGAVLMAVLYGAMVALAVASITKVAVRDA